MNWTLLLDVSLADEEWHFSDLTDVVEIKIEQFNPPSVGRLLIAQVLTDGPNYEFLEVKPFPAQSDVVRTTLDVKPSDSARFIALRRRYAEIAEDAPQWHVKVWGSSVNRENLTSVLISIPLAGGGIPFSLLGKPGGAAQLDENGLVFGEQLPPWEELLAANLSATDALAIRMENFSIPTLDELGGEPRGAEARAKQYTDERVSGISFPLPTLAQIKAEPEGAEARAKQYIDQKILSTTLRINCGSISNYIDRLGNAWSLDVSASSGTRDTGANQNYPVVPSDFPDIYNSNRYGSDFNYQVAVSPGIYSLTLFFCERWVPAGSRFFNIDIQGVRRESNLDIAALAGGTHKELIRSYSEVVVPAGIIAIRFQRTGTTGEPAQINAIRIFRVA